VDIPREGGAGFGGCVWLRGFFYRRKTFACTESLRWGRGGSGGEMWRRLLGLLVSLSGSNLIPKATRALPRGDPPSRGVSRGPVFTFPSEFFSGRRPIFGCAKPCRVRIII
jgi:hypothetical protein